MNLHKTHKPGIWGGKCQGVGCPDPYHRLPGAGPVPAYHNKRGGLERDGEKRWVKWGR